MAEITAALVKELREKSGAGMMDCKKALVENNGDVEAAMDWLRTKGLSKAAKKSDRVAAEGLVAVASREDGKGETAAVIEFNAETDFVARNELFQNAAKAFAEAALDAEGVEGVNAATLSGGKTVQDEVTNLIATIGENMQVRRVARHTCPKAWSRPTSTTPWPPRWAASACWWRWKAPRTRPPCVTWAARSACTSPPPRPCR